MLEAGPYPGGVRRNCVAVASAKLGLPAFALADDGYLFCYDGEVYSGSDWMAKEAAMLNLPCRELLEMEKPEIVIVATPDHWHPLITIAACEAGAHVYIEKPICHTITEGRTMVKAAVALQLTRSHG